MASPTVVVTAIRSPAMISGRASGTSTRQRSCLSVRPMPRPASLVSSGTLSSPVRTLRKMISSDVGDERDQRRVVAAPGDRQQQEEGRDARDGVEDARDLRDRVDQPAAPVGDQREREGDREADRHGEHGQVDVLEEGVDVAVEVVGDPVRAEAVVRLAACRCGRGSGPGRARGSRRPRRPHGGPARGESSGHGARISIERTPHDLAALVHHRAVLGLLGEQVRERVAQDVVQLDHRLGLRASARPSRARPAARARTASRAAGRRRRSAAGRAPRCRRPWRAPRPRGSPTRTSGAFQRSTSRTRWSASRLSARSAPTKSSTKLFGRVHQQLRGRRVLGELAAALHDRDAVAHLDRLVDVVGDEHDRLADLALEAQELVLEPLAVDRVDRAEGLVHQHQRRVRPRAPAPRRRAGAARPRAAPGKRSRVSCGIEADELEQLVHARRGCGPSTSRAGAAPWRCCRPRSRCGNRPICWIA